MTKTGHQIKIAFTGYVSVGKSTIINSLLRKKVTEAKPNRTTAGINFINVFTSSNSPSSVRSTESVHAEIEADNQKLRGKGIIQEKHFDIEIEAPLFEMRDDTELLIVDVPGMNEADTSQIYRNYVEDSWDTFDCMIVVMDARQGVNTEEQVSLLKFVKTNLDEKKNLPVIILANKVDDPEEDDIFTVIEELEAKVIQILYPEEGSQNDNQIVFLPISGLNAFPYRYASTFSKEELWKVDKKLIKKIGCAEVGERDWKKMTQEEQLNEAYDALNDKERYDDCLSKTNFDKFIASLTSMVGGAATQTELIAAQQRVALKKLDDISGIAPIGRILHQLGKVTNDLNEQFWTMYEVCENEVFDAFWYEPDVTLLIKPMEELHRYQALLTETGWKDDQIITKMKELVCRQFRVMIAKKQEWELGKWYTTVFNDKQTVDENNMTWSDMSPHDWATAIGSAMLLSSEKTFYMSFGKEKLILERQLQQSIFALEFHGSMIGCKTCRDGNNGKSFNQTCCSCTNQFKNELAECLDGSYENGVFKPTNEKKYNSVVHIHTPESLTQHTHWGHLVWKYCEFVAAHSQH